MGNKRLLKIGLVQQSCSDSREQNIANSIGAIRDAAAQGARLVLLQELHGSLYFCQTENTDFFDLAETIPGPTTDLLGALAAELGIVIVCSIFERRGAGVYHNTAVVLESNGSIKGVYRKMHIPDDPGYYEKFYFTPGDTGFTPINTTVGCLGILICWDQWYPEAARLTALAGAEILLYPTAIGWDPNDSDDEKKRQLDAWLTIQRSHAIANGLYVASCNRCGFENSPIDKHDGIAFWGGSFVAGPQGEILAMAPSDSEKVLVTEFDLDHGEQVRRIWPFFRDRRIDVYSDLTKRLID